MSARPTAKRPLGLASLALAVGFSSPAGAGTFADLGVRSSRVSVCFVPGAFAARPTRVAQIQAYLAEIEGAANIRFDHQDSCPSPTSQADGSDFHDGDIRVQIPYTGAVTSGPVPGNGCTAVNPNSSWSAFPDDLEKNRACLYNLLLFDDADASGTQWRNHTLHEFGHGLGLRHEHEREDASAVCAAAGGDGTSYLTRYDPASVMHYKVDSCGINGNYDHTGLSPLDRLSLHILYPEERRVAEYAGRTVLRAGERLALGSAWEVAGADIRKVARRFRWRIGGVLVSTASRVNLRLRSPGTATLQLGYHDFLGRSYYWSGAIRVLDPKEFDGQMAAVAGGLTLMTTY